MNFMFLVLLSFLFGFIVDFAYQAWLVCSKNGQWFRAGMSSVIIFLCGLYAVYAGLTKGMAPVIGYAAGLFAGTAFFVWDAHKGDKGE